MTNLRYSNVGVGAAGWLVRLIAVWRAVAVAAAVSAAMATEPARAEPTPVSLATATPGGGFPTYGDAAAAVINATDPSLLVTTQNTKGSLENLQLLERGAVDLALVAGIPAREALSGSGRAPTTAKVLAAIYSDFGLFAVRADSAARTVADLKGQAIAWGAPASGLTSLGAFAMAGLGLDRDKDFKPVFLEKAGDAPGMLARGEVAAVWGGGIGWPNFVVITKAGGRLIGFAPDEVARILAKHPTLSAVTVPAGSFAGQDEALSSVGSWSLVMARADLPEETAYRLARAFHRGGPALAVKLPQARETTVENTLIAAGERARLHPGVERYLREIGR